MSDPKFTLTIELGNAAMSTPDDVAEALRQVAQHVEDQGRLRDRGGVSDVNGNKVGTWSASWPEGEES